MRNTIYLRRKLKLIVPPGNAELAPDYLAMLLKNIESLGFTFSPALIERAASLQLDQLVELYEELVPALKALVGANVTFKPMYPNFPNQVMELSTARLYLNAIIHYLTGALPHYEKQARSPLIGAAKLRAIDLGDEADFSQIYRRLLGARTALSPADKEDLDWFTGERLADLESILPEEIPVKENMAYLAGLLLSAGVGDIETILFRYIKTATDVLRLAAALSGGDVSLAAPARFRSFKRAERRLLLRLLETCANPTEDMLRYREPWVRLGERLHPGEHKERCPKSAAAFDTLRNNKPFQTFNSTVERALAAHDSAAAASLLRLRPGELARRLDHLLRTASDPSAVLATFEAVAAKVSTPVLLQMLAHFTHRHEQRPLRTFFPKGNVARAQTIANALPELAAPLCAAVVAICQQALIQRFALLPPLGRVYIDEQLRQYTVPLAQRSASKSLRTLGRGSRMPLPPGSTIRFFLWWKEGSVDGKPTGRVDIDLSAVLYQSDWKYREHISYTNLKSSTYRAAHSGDITSAPNGACEFIDIDIDSVLTYGGRYVLMALNSFTKQPYCDLPECYAGWMMRSQPQSGEIFEPRTVQDKIDIAADTRICLPVILDLHERTVIWTDLALRSNPRWYNNVEGNAQGMLLMGQAMTSLVKPNLYDLFTLHARARGELGPQDSATTVFAVESGITPFDTDRIVAEYL